jgi:tetratricopeptide (TPR) repeat protein
MKNQSNHDHILANALAELFSTPKGARTIARFQALAFETPESMHEGQDSVPTLGIWTLTGKNPGELERNSKFIHEWHYWADISTIPPKNGKMRIALLGESVARAYLFDPLITFASLVESAFSSAGHAVEIIDLARTDLTIGGMMKLLHQLPALKPDAIVCFCGNNWYKLELHPREYLDLAAGLQQGGYPEMARQFREEIMANHARQCMDKLADVAAHIGCQVAVVVPEFNLIDWQSEDPVGTPNLACADMAEWFHHLDLANCAYEKGNYLQAAQHYTRQLELDGGTSWVSLRQLGLCRERLGDRAAAKSALELARDAVCGMFVHHSPRCPKAIQQVLRNKSRQHKFQLVDLPEIFESVLNGALPGRQFFLDYCHLNFDGLRLAAVETAKALIASEDGTVTGVDFAQLRIPFDRKNEAIVHFLAAIHNAHYGQGIQIIRHHCARALDLSSDAAEPMQWYLDLQSRQAPSWMCSSYDKLCQIPIIRRYLSVADPHMNYKFDDTLLVKAISEELATRNFRARDSIWTVEPETMDHSWNLLAPSSSARTFRERMGYALGIQRGYHRATTRQSRFHLAGHKSGPYIVQLTARVPGAVSPSQVTSVRVNDHLVFQTALGGSWKTCEWQVDAGMIHPGPNLITIDWPIPNTHLPEQVDAGVALLEKGIMPDPLPAFGDVHSFVMHAGRMSST